MMFLPAKGRRIDLGFLALAVIALCAASAVWAGAPPGYYAPVDTANATALRLTLHDVIKDHVRFPYTAATTDTWDIINLADEDPGNTNNILDLYKNASYTKIPGGVGAYNREHSWPKSYGFPNDGDGNYPYTDCHHLFAADSSYNTTRSNKPFRVCNATCTEQPTDFNDGRGGGSGVYPGNSNWTSGSFTQGTWETWSGRKGDVARALFYMDVRYEGGVHGVTGFAEPDLRLTDDEALIDLFNTGANEAVAYMGMLTVLLQWHQQDPPDTGEMARNDVVFSFQGNRNPFVDHPEWVACVFQNVCSFDPIPPGAPQGLMATALSGGADLSWLANGEPDLAGYNVYRATSPGGPYTRVNGALVGTNAYTDTGLTNGTTYYYVVTAVDTSANESADSNEAAVTPDGPPPVGGGSVILSEVLYDVSSTDDGFEWVELYNSGSTPVDLAGFSLGNGGTDYTYSLVQLAGTIGPGETFVVGGPSSSSINANPVFDLVVNFSPDFQNGGTAGDGVALFDVPAAQVTAFTVPIDAVVYGPNNNSGLIDETGVANAPEVGDAPAGSSLERVDLAGSWQIQPAPTPNATLLTPPSNTAPSVTITAPADASTFFDGALITFIGSAGDAEDGDLTAGLSWSSDLDGPIGTGGSFSTTLSIGTHVVTAAVTDSGGLQASDAITVTVDPVSGGGFVILSEVLYDVSGNDNGREWVELYNPGPGAVDLSTYSLGNGGTDYTASLVQLSGTIQPGATFVVGGPTASGTNGNPVFDLAVDFNPDFQNSGSTGDGVALFDVPASQVTAFTVPVDAVIYGPNNNSGLIDETGAASAPDVGDAAAGSSIERLDLAGAWTIQANPTPGSTPLAP